MADNLCGGSTPFKALVDHHSSNQAVHDTSRFNPQNPEGQSFRSTNNGSHDAAFSSFMAPGANTNPMAQLGPLMQTPMLQHEHTHTANLAYRPVNNQLPDQTQNFHQPDFNISPNSLVIQPSDKGQAVPPRPFGSPALAALNYGQRQPARTVMPMSPVAAFQQNLDAWIANNSGVINKQEQNDATEAELDFSEVNDIMDKLADDLARDVKVAPVETEPPPNSMRSGTDATLPTMESAPDLASQPVAEDSNQTSDIAAVARQILVSVEHEDDEKWKNSSFLALMRDFRDGNKEIVNDEIKGGAGVSESAT